MDKVLVIIVTYNANLWIRQCLNSVDMERYDVFVVDNASMDDTLQILEDYPRAIVRQMDRNLGFGQANNIGLHYAIENGYDYVLLLNQDAWLLPDTIEQLMDAHQRFPQFWILSPMQMHSKTQSIEKQFQIYLNRCDFVSKTNSPIEINFVNAAIWLIPISCLRIVGGFDPLFPHYGEDNDFVHRVHYWGGKVGITPLTMAYHEREIKVTKGHDDRYLYRLKMVYLNLLKNINYSLWINLLILFGYSLKCAIKSFLKWKWSEVHINFVVLVYCLRQYNNIQQHRMETRKPGAFL